METKNNEKPKTFAIIGGDKRNIELAKILHSYGHNVKLFGFVNHELELHMQCKNLQESVAKADYIIGPIPVSHNGEALNAPFHNSSIYIDDLFKIIKPHQLFLAGLVKQELLDRAKKYDIQIIDLLKREDLLIKNAIPTSEGALKIAIEETDVTLHDSNMMIIGYGRIGKILAGMLRGIGANVFAVVNSDESAAAAKSAGHTAIHFTDLNEHLKYANVIFNTVPKTLLDKSNMKDIPKNTLIIDLASPPYGVDVNSWRDFGLKVLYASSLPGKVAPVTTATYIWDTVKRILEEKEND